MCNRNRMLITVMVICLGLAGMYSAGSDVWDTYRAQKKQKTADKKHPTAMELLDKFTETADKTSTSFITKAKCKIVSNIKNKGEFAYENGKKPQKYGGRSPDMAKDFTISACFSFDYRAICDIIR